MKATTSIILDRRRIKGNGKYPVKLRVYFNRKREYYPLDVDMLEDTFERCIGLNPRKEYREYAMKFQSFENKAAGIIDLLGDSFSYSNFEKHFLSNSSLKGTLKGEFQSYIDNIEPERIGTIGTYERSMNAFEAFKPGALVADVSVKFLTGFEAWMDKKGNSKTTTGIYCRSLRSLLNSLIADGKMSITLYPFGSSKKRKYEIPTSKNTKKALSLNDIGLIANYECTGNRELCRDYWMFLYLGNGLNVADFCRLKWTDIKDGRISFIREKTIRTKKDVQLIQIIIQPLMQVTIDKWGKRNSGNDGFIFPHIDSTMDDATAYKTVTNLTRMINDNIKTIAEEVGLERKVTTYYARHSFATILKNNGAPVAMISQALGHSSLATTQNYLDSFEDDQLKNATAALMNFKNN